MKKRIFILIAALALLTVIFTSCECKHENCSPATCTEPSRCLDCGEIISNALGHTDGEWITDKEPNCTEDGSKHQVCSICNDTIKTENLTKLSHSFTNYVSNNDATCTADGTKTAKCDNCDVMDTKKDVDSKLGHTYQNTLVRPTKTDEGYTIHTCLTCQYTYTDSYVPATGSIGLSYMINEINNTCTITGIGTCTDSHVVIPESIYGYPVTEISESAFEYCYSLMFITIPNSVTSIGYNAFADCKNLKSITIPDSVTSIEPLTFRGCNNLTSITIPNSVTSIKMAAFFRCNNLASITIPDSVTSIGTAAFAYCNNLTSITIPDSVTSIGDQAFANCNSLTSITISDSVTSIGMAAFYDCSSLVYNEDSDAYYIGSDTNPFLVLVEVKDKSIVSFEINSNTRIILYDAFRECSSLTSIVIPDSVTSIGDGAFSGCTSLTSVKFEGTVSQWKSISLGSYWNYKIPATEVVCSGGRVSLN